MIAYVEDIPLVRPLSVVLASLKANIHSMVLSFKCLTKNYEPVDSRVQTVSFYVEGGFKVRVGGSVIKISIPIRCIYLKISVGGVVFYENKTTTGKNLLQNMQEEAKVAGFTI